MPVSSTSQSALLLGSAVIILTYAVLRWKQRNTKPMKWKKVGEISEIYVYPLKSGCGIQLEEGECTDFGLRSTGLAPKQLQYLQDRCLLVYNANSGTFVTCRTYPSLMLVKISNGGDGTFIFEAPDVPQFKLKPPYRDSSESKKVSMWFEEEVEAVDCGDEAAKWISSYLKKEDNSLRIGWYETQDNAKRRNLNIPPWDKFAKFYNRMKNAYTGAFADLASFMLISESSLNDLKSKLPAHLQGIPAKQFRPNLVIRGAEPYEEDNWDWIKIGENVVMQGFKPCTRCIMTTMDPETGMREPQQEPLRTMKTYRKMQHPVGKELEGESPVMGLYAGLHKAGIVKIGYPVYINVS